MVIGGQLVFLLECLLCVTGVSIDKTALRNEVLEMFDHAYNSYMKYAFPADELMPLTCQGRYRGVQPSRGDIDDACGNFSLTLVDTLDTLAVLGKFEEFANAVELVVKNVGFDTDVVVSVFEVNIRMVGGLISGHLMAKIVQEKTEHLRWYTDELLLMAEDLATRLLPAFNTSTGLPYPRVNLKFGLDGPARHLREMHDTCVACGGSNILEFAALSRLTGNPVFELKARKAMDFLWKQRHRGSDLVGTVLNVHNGDWIRRESGVGAGIDSYYEYCLKAYILLGDETYLFRFIKHYDAVMKYVSQGPFLMDVQMHRPTQSARSFMDALWAFWPGLQVLKGDLKGAIETHEVLYQIVQKHNFLPEAFTHDFQIHWGQHPLRPEFIESTYFLYKATKDEYYLEVGKNVIESLQKYARVGCGFAAVNDLRINSHEDRMDSFVLAETFKYLFLLFADDSSLIFHPDNFVFTTEAHLLPLSISGPTNYADSNGFPTSGGNVRDSNEKSFLEEANAGHRECQNIKWSWGQEMQSFAASVRHRVKNTVKRGSEDPSQRRQNPLLVQPACVMPKKPSITASEFNIANKLHMDLLTKMGISVVPMADGKIKLIHSASNSASADDAQSGLAFMQEMIELAKRNGDQAIAATRVVQPLTAPFYGYISLAASPAQFGPDSDDFDTFGEVVLAKPFRACEPLENSGEVKGQIVVVERSDCMFVEKVANVQNAGGIGVIIVDNNRQSDFLTSPPFAMAGDGGQTQVSIPTVFLFRKEAEQLILLLRDHPDTVLSLSQATINPRLVIQSLFGSNLLNAKAVAMLSSCAQQ